MKITNAVLAERIDNRGKSMIDKIDEVQKSVDKIKINVNANTEFRLQAKGAMALFGSLVILASAGITWTLNKIRGN